MDDRLSALERQVDELARALGDMRQRLVALEDARPAVRASALGELMPATHAPAVEAAADENEVASVLALAGRACLILGGAYLLRALTGGAVPRPIGTAIGFAYAVAWLAVAYRDSSQPRLAPPLYGAVAALIAFPILWEATISFHLLSPAAAAVAMTGFTALALAVAWRRRLQALAWITTIAGVCAAPLFMLALGPILPFGFYLAFLGVVTLWMGYSLDWIWLRWPVAFVVDLTVVIMTASVTGVWQREGASGVMLLQLVLFGGYLVSIAARTIWRSRDVIPFEVIQTLALLVVAFGGAAYVMIETGSGAGILGLASLVFGIGSYGVAFAFVDWRRGHWKNFVFYTSLGLVFIVAGTGLSLGAPSHVIAWTGLAVASAALSYRFATLLLWPHTAVYILAAGLMSGLLGLISDAFTASSTVAWAVLTWPAALALAGAGVCCAAPIRAGGESWGPYGRAPKLIVSIVLLLGAGGFLIALSVPLTAGRPGAGADPAIVAGVRTLVLAAAALLLAWLGGRGTFPEGRWLTYVVLVVGGLKLLLNDLLAGRPATLFVSLAVYGTALIVAPKWARRRGPARRRAAPGRRRDGPEGFGGGPLPGCATVVLLGETLEPHQNGRAVPRARPRPRIGCRVFPAGTAPGRQRGTRSGRDSRGTRACAAVGGAR